MSEAKIDAALIYCRVSSKKQEIEGSGKLSQEHRCRQYAATLGVPVETVFGDTKTAGGDFMKRPGMVGVIQHLRANRRKRYIVIFDDLKRFARDTEFHWTLRRTLEKYDAIPYCLNFRFENTAEGRFFETIVAAGGELERHQLGRQAVQKMTARVEQGYHVTKAPLGYRYQRTKAEGALLVPNEPFASIVKEALEGFASRRFESLAEVQRFLESFPEWPRQKSGKRKGLTNENIVSAMLRHHVYAGLVSAPYWGVTIREGRHQALISIETHDRIISRLKGDKRAPARKDLSKDFPLRGFVNCACGTPLTASWPRGRSGHYAYYFCFKRGCASYGKSIRRDKIEGEFEALLKALTPSANLVRLAADMFERAWEMRRRTMTGRLDGLRAQLRDTERQIEATVDRVVEAKTQVVAHALEERVEKLTKEKLVLAEKIARGAQPLKSFEQSLRTALTFLAEPWKLWNSDSIEHKRAVLKLAFAGQLQYARNEGFRTADLALPFMALADFSAGGKRMVGATGIEPVTPPV
ncbi:MAG: recombinase family protein [Hyphomonadaceae bacterium]|nr:recombinase family protein [Hyphomonadaceae bacterium]